MKKIFIALLLWPAMADRLSAQNEPSGNSSPGEIHGNVQMDAQYYREDTSIGAAAVPENVLMNGFSNIVFTKGKFQAGLRYESYLNPMLGYDPRYKGSGIPYRYATYTVDELEVTAGNFYEQFGSGMVLRAYEEKGLGIDNAFDGLRLRYNIQGIYLKGLIGRQRSYFQTGPGIVRGFDGEIHFSELIPKWSESKSQWVIGGSFVSKYQQGSQVVYQASTLKVPQNVGASAGRIGFSRGKVSLNGEYVYKINDPDAINGFIYNPGEAILFNGTYSKKGFGVSLGMKRVDNMSFKSDRSATGSDLAINFLPAMAKQHTYALLAFYPYATQATGEISWQGDINYKVKKETALGGKYGMDINLNYSAAYGLDTTPLPVSQDSSRRGYTVNYFGIGDLYFQDINVEITKKVSPKLKLIIQYANQSYNKDVVEGAHGEGIIYSNIAMLQTIYKISDSRSVRTELQHLYTEQDKKSWAMALVEVGLGEHWMLSAMDLYNYGNDVASKRKHYYNGNIIYVKGTTRIALGYGKQRAGIFCVGGVCRYVPASNGISLAVTSSF